jgi:hypothetical protein
MLDWDLFEIDVEFDTLCGGDVHRRFRGTLRNQPGRARRQQAYKPNWVTSPIHDHENSIFFFFFRMDILKDKQNNLVVASFELPGLMQGRHQHRAAGESETKHEKDQKEEA